MPIYSYTVKDTEGKTKTDIVSAQSEDALVEKLQNEGYFIVNIRQTMGKAGQQGNKKGEVYKFDHDAVRIEDLLVLSRQLATMLQAGVTMLRSLDVILAQIQSKQLFTVVTKIHDDIEQGSSLSSALGKHPKIM